MHCLPTFLLLQLTSAAIFHIYPSPDSFCGCIQKLSQPGDTCVLHTGRYRISQTCKYPNIQGTQEAPILITSAGDGEVIIDGTIPISPNAWTPTNDGKFSIPIHTPIYQLFVNNQLQVLARFPNAKWSDRSVFYAVKNWFRSKPPGTHDLNTGVGLLHDQGQCSDPSLCCSRCNFNDLAISKINATGAQLVGNFWSCDTGIQNITRHAASNPSVLHYDATYKGLCDTYRNGDGRYYVYGTRNLLDAPEEWLLTKENNEYQVLVAHQPTKDANITGRVIDYALTVNNAKWLVIANLSFHAATLNIAGEVSNVTLSSLIFNYSAVSTRAFNATAPPKTLNLWRTKRANDAPSGFLLEDLTVRYSDGPALLLSGAQTQMRDCLFEWNDWTTVGGAWPDGVPIKGKAQRATTIRVNDDSGLLLHRLTFRNNGAAQSINAGGSNSIPATVQLCNFQTQLAIQDDGSFVEGGGSPSTIYQRNWCTNSGKSGLRWDGFYPGTIGGVMVENVVWNATGLTVKGDQHNVTRNTVFDGSDTTPSHAKNDRPRYQDHTSVLNNWTIASVLLGAGTNNYNPKADQLTTFTHNIFDWIFESGKTCPDKPCTLPGKYDSNLIGTETPQGPGIPFDIRSELRDPYHMDFRSCPKSNANKYQAGAYSTWTNNDVTYWIPGKRNVGKASIPLPPMSSIGIYLNTDLMFLPGRNAVRHEIYLYNATMGKFDLLKSLKGADMNVVQTEQVLMAGKKYLWRVDAYDVHGTMYVGDVWEFETDVKGQMSCEIIPHPPTPPAPPGPEGCKAVEEKYCQGDQGQGGKKGDVCFDCVVKNNKAFAEAGCWHGKERHAFIEAWCGE